MAQLYLLIRLYTHLESFVKVLCVVLEVNSPKSKLMRNIGSLFYARIRDFGTNALRIGWMEIYITQRKKLEGNILQVFIRWMKNMCLLPNDMRVGKTFQVLPHLYIVRVV